MAEGILIAKITSLGVDRQHPEGWVALPPYTFAIQAVRRTANMWEPVYGIKVGEGRFDLPACFALDDNFQEALEMAMELYYKEGGQ